MKSQSFTLIEFLIYIALLSLVLLALGMSISNVLETKTRTRVILEVTQNGRFALQKIGQYIKEASTTTLATESNSLTLLGFKDPTKNPTTFEVLNGVLVIKEGNRDYTPLTTQEIKVDYLGFQKISSPYLNSIKIEMILSFLNPQNLPQLDFSNFFESSFPLGI